MTARKTNTKTEEDPAEPETDAEEVDDGAEAPEPEPKRDRTPPADPFTLACSLLGLSGTQLEANVGSEDARMIVVALNALTLAFLSTNSQNPNRQWALYNAMAGSN